MSVGGSGKIPVSSTFVDTSSTTAAVEADVDIGEVSGAEEAGDEEQVDKDKFDTTGAGKISGPQTGGEVPDDYAVAAALFADAGLPSPWNNNTTPGVESRAATDPLFQQLLGTIKASPNFDDPKVCADFLAKLGMTKICSNIMETLLVLIKESVRESNEDKRYYLLKMQQFNAIGEALSGEMHKLSNAMSKLRARGKDEDNEPTVDIGEIRMIDPKDIGANNTPITNADSYTGHKTLSNLQGISKDLETRQEDLRNNRQMAQTGFQTADQRTNQLMNIMATVLKSMNEMRGASSRGLS